MRDHQSINKLDADQVTTHYDSLNNPGCGSFPYTTTSSTNPVYPILRKGRADITTGPKPYPTPYHAHRLAITPIWSKHVTTKFAWRRGCSWHTAITTVSRCEPQSVQNICSGLTSFTENGLVGYKPNISTSVKSRARNSALSKLRSEKVNLGQSLGEIPSTLRELTKLLKGIGAALLAFKRGRFRQAIHHVRMTLSRKRRASLSREIAGAYLTWKFGIAPLLNDAEHLISEIGKAMDQPDFIKVKGTATEEVSIWEPDGYVGEGSLLAVCEVGYTVAPTEDFARAFLGLSNPVGTLWELVPLSFVINWFISIGDVLNSLDAGAGLVFTSGYETRVIKGQTSIYKPGSSHVNEGYDANIFAMERVVLPSIPLPGLHLKFNLGTGQLVSLAALARALT